jgi:hypothetical protein
MENKYRMPLSEFVKLDENELSGWIYIQPNPHTGLVDLNSFCLIENLDKLTRFERGSLNEKMSEEGFVIVLTEPWEFFGC